MGLRGEIFSTRVLLQNRTYFFNVKENRLGDLYLNVVESKNRDEGGFDRQSVILFADDLQEFLKGFDESLRALEKEVRERRRSSRAARPPRDGQDARDGKERARGGDSGSGQDRRRGDGRKPGARPADGERPRRERPPRDGSSGDGGSRDGAPPKGRRVVVRKR